MLGSTAQNTGERRVPDRLQGGVIGLAFLQPQQPLGVTVLDELDLFHVHLDIVEFVSTDDEARIHAPESSCSIPTDPRNKGIGIPAKKRC
jgi:hypothetical protein